MPASTPLRIDASPPPALRGYGHVTRYFDRLTSVWTAQIIAGEVYVGADDEDISTVLGSCVAVCMRDARAGVGGMNHFLLGGDGSERELRYGEYATRFLINALLEHGARRERLEVSLFGGGRVLSGHLDIGAGNIDFIRGFVARERLPVMEESLGGPYSRRVRYNPRTGVARMVMLGA